MELDVTQLEVMAQKAHSEFSYVYKVLKEANTTKEDEKKLVKLATEKYRACEELCAEIENQLGANLTNDDVRYLVLTIREFRKGMEEFKNLYVSDSEPNA